MHRHTVLFLAGILCVGIPAIEAYGQTRVPCPVAQPGRIVLYGDIAAPIALSAEDLQALPQVTVRETPHSGEAGDYVGPRLEDVLARAGLRRGAELRGAEITRYVAVEAADGYRAVFALAEIDAAFRTDTPILALRRNGAALDAQDGPFQVVVPGEMRHARWVRQVACVRIARDPGAR